MSKAIWYQIHQNYHCNLSDMVCCLSSWHNINNARNSSYMYLFISTRHPVLLVSNRGVRDGAREHETNKQTKNILNSIILFLLSCGCISLFCENWYFFHVYCCWKRAAILKPVLVLSFYLVIPKAYTIARRFRQEFNSHFGVSLLHYFSICH